MVWPRLRRRRASAGLPSLGPCGSGRHALRTERLLLFTPENKLDLAAALAAASDPVAQHWLGWTDNVVADARVREAIVHLRPGDPGSLRSAPLFQRLLAEPVDPADLGPEWLVAVRADDGRYAGCTQVGAETGEVGGWLAPHARGERLGSELFRAAVHFGHAHLGLPVLRAGHEGHNAPSGRALAGAGFVPADGPPLHTLANGRETEARWLRHTASEPAARCPGAPVATPAAPDAAPSHR
ncbi:GNAT family N-acetyltransferase [Streptomyces sp. TLI_171]|uniref:GNAT family N-acetyltransferase n=1 Tax=Streptomyces sp. TLI_171 TaxID=1938859 RepID=UPI000C19C45E|nr:GNAT family protein [Streptomyces sp. TLI_171]RKE17498.1 RimJ/RimL family protein N-acetyltransferase [Streptomyces sp. TLI_171]